MPVRTTRALVSATAAAALTGGMFAAAPSAAAAATGTYACSVPGGGTTSVTPEFDRVGSILYVTFDPVIGGQPQLGALDLTVGMPPQTYTLYNTLLEPNVFTGPAPILNSAPTGMTLELPHTGVVVPCTVVSSGPGWPV
ncbi:hypothetical protein [Yinghuangia sp. YIM S09857]|uniref:hypothetical protein n=1 Tax=Yinghuangia sp. YIM S09857 TaxID=3436929 RepID=UPI003F53177A